MMLEEALSRTELLLGEEAVRRISSSRVILFGVGGVGGWCAEALARSGVGSITLVDSDTVNASNINRQVVALTSTIGEPKVEVMKRRLLDINPDASVTAMVKFYDDASHGEFNLGSYDYVIDAIDSLASKASLMLRATASGAKLFSALGAARKTDPTLVRVAPFWDVKGCPLGAALRKRFRQQGVMPSAPFQCVYGEEVLPNLGTGGEGVDKGRTNGSLVSVVAIFGFTLAGLVIKDMLESAHVSRP